MAWSRGFTFLTKTLQRSGEPSLQVAYPEWVGGSSFRQPGRAATQLSRAIGGWLGRDFIVLIVLTVIWLAVQHRHVSSLDAETYGATVDLTGEDVGHRLDPGAEATTKPTLGYGNLRLPYGSSVSFFVSAAGESYLTFRDLDLGDPRGYLRVTGHSEEGRLVEHHVRRAMARRPVPLSDGDPLAQITLTAVLGGRSEPNGEITIRGLELRSRGPVELPAARQRTSWPTD